MAITSDIPHAGLIIVSSANFWIGRKRKFVKALILV